MKRSRNFRALVRATGVTAAVVISVGGITFAALQSQQDVLMGNTIETATADLRLSTDGINYSNSHTGFDFNGLIPGGPAQPATGYPFYLKNAGNAPLGLKLAVSSVPSNPDNVDLGKVNVLLTTVGSGSGPQSFSLQSLLAGPGGGGGQSIATTSMPSGTTQQYKLQVSMASDAVNSPTASLGNIDFAFSATAQAN
jgi:hypothetical protein